MLAIDTRFSLKNITCLIFLIEMFCFLSEMGTKFYELDNVAINAAYYQRYVVCVLFIFLNFYSFLYLDFLLRLRTSKVVDVLVVVRVPQF